jgi:hypothetical protein
MQIKSAMFDAEPGVKFLDLPVDANIFKIVGTGSNVHLWYTTNLDDPTTFTGRTRRFHVLRQETNEMPKLDGLEKLYLDSVMIVTDAAAAKGVVRHVWEIDPPLDQQAHELVIPRLLKKVAELEQLLAEAGHRIIQLESSPGSTIVEGDAS